MFALALLVAIADPTPPVAAPAPSDAPKVAPTAPTSDEIKRVNAYYLYGQTGGPVLIDFIACKKTGKTAEGKLTCDERLGDKAKKGDPLIAFVKFFVPKGADYKDLSVRFLLNGEERSSSTFTLSESWTGYTNYKQTTASKPGTWEMQVTRNGAVLASAKVVVE